MFRMHIQRTRHVNGGQITVLLTYQQASRVNTLPHHQCSNDES